MWADAVAMSLEPDSEPEEINPWDRWEAIVVDAKAEAKAKQLELLER